MARGRPTRPRGRGRAATDIPGGSRDTAPAGTSDGDQSDPQPLGQSSDQQLRAEVAELRGQLTALTGIMQQFLQQQQTAAVAPPVAPPVPPPVAPPIPPPVPPTVPTTPVTGDTPVIPPPTPATATTSAGGTGTSAAEGARIRAMLTEFRKFDPPMFEGKREDKGTLELWTADMEKLFRDLHIAVEDRVPLAAHCLGRTPYSWWFRHFSKKLDNVYPTWEEFRSLLYEQYFGDSTRQSLERELERLRQGDRTVAEYEQDFTRIIEMIPFTVRDEYHKARLFMRGLRPNLRMLTASNGAITYDACLERAFLLQSESEDLKADRDAAERSGDKKRSHAQSSGDPSFSRRPPKHQRSQQSNRSAPHPQQSNWSAPRPQQSTRSAPRLQQPTRGAPSGSYRPGQRCVICGQGHPVSTCPEKGGRCFRCGLPGHLQAQCPRGNGATQSVASSPAAPPRQNRGASGAAAPSGRPSSSHQTEGTRQASGGRVFALTQHEGNTRGDHLAGIVTLSASRARALFDTGATLSFISHFFG